MPEDRPGRLFSRSDAHAPATTFSGDGFSPEPSLLALVAGGSCRAAGLSPPTRGLSRARWSAGSRWRVSTSAPAGAGERGPPRFALARRALLGTRPLGGAQSRRSARGPFGSPATTSVPVVPIAFQNVVPPFPAADYAAGAVRRPRPRPLPTASGPTTPRSPAGTSTIDGEVLDWVSADSTDTYYEDGCNGVGVLNACPHGGQRFGELLLEALQQDRRRHGGLGALRQRWPGWPAQLRR